MNHAELDHLVDEWATAALGEERDPKELLRLVEAIRSDSQFAQRTAEVFLTMRTLSLPNLAASHGAPQVAPVNTSAWYRSWKPAAAALLFGLVLGRFSSSVRDEALVAEPEQATIAVQVRSETPLEPKQELRSLSIQPYRYADGLFSGKSIEVVTRNN